MQCVWVPQSKYNCVVCELNGSLWSDITDVEEQVMIQP